MNSGPHLASSVIVTLGSAFTTQSGSPTVVIFVTCVLSICSLHHRYDGHMT